jgi:AsmA protein
MFVLRPFAWLFAVLMVILVAVAIFTLTFDVNRYKPDIVALVKQQTGRDLTVDGGIGLSVYPDIALKLEQVKLGNAAGFSGESFARADHARVSVQLMPLLQQQLRVNEVTLQGMSLNLERDHSGKTNWADLLPTKANQPDDQIGQVIARLLGNFMVAGISVKDSQIRWHDMQSGQSMNLAPLNLKTGTLRPDKPVDISLATRIQQNAPALDMTLSGSTTAKLAENRQDFTLSGLQLTAQAEGIHAEVKGTLRGESSAQQLFMPDLQATLQLPQQGNAQLSGRLQVNLNNKTASIGGLHAQAQLTSPQAGKVDAKLNADAHLEMASNILKLDGMQLQAKTQGGNLPMQTADVQASGSARLQLAQQQLTIGGMQLTTNLQGDKLPGGSLQQQGKGELNLNWGNGTGVIDLFQTSLKLMGQQLNGKLQIRNPMAVVSMNGEFKADALNYPPFQLQKATLGVQMTDGILTLAPQGTLFKGGYQGNIQINTKQSPPTLQMTHKTSGLRTEDLFFALTQDKTVTGALNLTANLTSVAGDAAAFKQHLNGTVDVALKDGTIRDSSFAQKTKQVVKLFEKESTNAMGEKEVAFTSLGGQWQVHQGTFHTNENVLLAPYFQVKGSGDVNIVNESLDFKLRIGEKPKPDKPEGLFAPLRIQGPWKNLSYALELDVLLKELAQQEIDKQKADLQEKLDAEKQKQLDALKQKVDEEKARLQQQLQTEKDKLQQRLQDQVQKQLGGSGDPNPADGNVEDQLKKKLEDDLKSKLKGLF